MLQTTTSADKININILIYYIYRPNIYLQIDKEKSAEIDVKLSWLVELLKKETIKAPKTIIYVR